MVVFPCKFFYSLFGRISAQQKFPDKRFLTKVPHFCFLDQPRRVGLRLRGPTCLLQNVKYLCDALGEFFFATYVSSIFIWLDFWEAWLLCGTMVTSFFPSPKAYLSPAHCPPCLPLFSPPSPLWPPHRLHGGFRPPKNLSDRCAGLGPLWRRRQDFFEGIQGRSLGALWYYDDNKLKHGLPASR